MDIRDYVYQLGEIGGTGAPTNEELLARITTVIKDAIRLPMVGLSVYEDGITSRASSVWVDGPWESFDQNHFLKQTEWDRDDRVLAKRLEQSPAGTVHRRSDLMQESEFYSTRLFNEFQRPLGIGDQVLARFRRRDGVELLVIAAQELESGTVGRAAVSRTEDLAGYAAQAWARSWRPEPEWISRLSPTATNVLELVLEGYDDTQISRMLGLTYHSVRAHLKRMFRHAGVRSRLHLMRDIRGPHQDSRLVEHKPAQEPVHG